MYETVRRRQHRANYIEMPNGDSHDPDVFEHRGADAVPVDPLNFDLGRTFKPHFAYAKDSAPAALDMLAGQIARADGYVMVSPEYNHSMSPALAHLLNHFGSSLFSL